MLDEQHLTLHTNDLYWPSTPMHSQAVKKTKGTLIQTLVVSHQKGQ
jgi:hypothetical protein